MERFVITSACMHVTTSYAVGDIVTDHITGEHLLALGFADYAPEDNPTDAAESDPTMSRLPADEDKE